jgi:ferric-chelate reductase
MGDNEGAVSLLSQVSLLYACSSSPSNPLTLLVASCTAVVREASYWQFSPSRISWIRIPSLGSIILVLTYLGYTLGLEFYDNDYPGAQHWQAKGLRAGWLAVAQLPLLLLLAGKNNLIGLAVGISYERLQILHRWVARVILLTATLHGGFQAYGWNRYGVLHVEISTDTCIPTGKWTGPSAPSLYSNLGSRLCHLDYPHLDRL